MYRCVWNLVWVYSNFKLKLQVLCENKLFFCCWSMFLHRSHACEGVPKEASVDANQHMTEAGVHRSFTQQSRNTQMERQSSRPGWIRFTLEALIRSSTINFAVSDGSMSNQMRLSAPRGLGDLMWSAGMCESQVVPEDQRALTAPDKAQVWSQRGVWVTLATKHTCGD